MISLDRRSLLVAGGAGAGLIVAFALWPREAGSPLVARKGEQLFGPYLKIGTDGTVTVAVPQAETGQGIWTGLAQIAAGELGAAWEMVAVEPAPVAPDYANSFFGTRLTAGSTSVRAFEGPTREAAGIARGMLVRAAAGRWDVDPSECTVAGGFVRHGGKALSFGELADEAAALRAGGPEGTLERRLLGQSLPRLDLPAKSNGSMRFAGDVRLKGMLFAAVRMAPPGGALTSFERAAGMVRSGVREIVADSAWVAAIAETSWAAEQALKAAAPRFSGRADADAAAIDRALDRGLAEGTVEPVASSGDFDSAVGNARALGATYRIAPALHHGLEPLSAVARFSGEQLEIWAPVQAHDLAVETAARAAGIDASTVTLYPTPVGDGAGRAVEADIIPIAVGLAKRTGKPVQAMLSATASQNHLHPRPPLLARMAAMPSPSGTIAAWSARFVTVPGLEGALARLTGKEPDWELAGAVPPYAIPTIRVERVRAELPIPFGYMRGGSEALTAFANESFIDELARNFGAEPLAFRMAMLNGKPRLARTLAMATSAAGWDGGGPGSRMGLACASAFRSHIALVAVAGAGPDQRVSVERLVAAVDCGRVINPGLVRQQVQGGLLHALSLVIAKTPEFVAAMPVARGYRSSGLEGALKVPEIRVDIVGSRAETGGVSGLGHVVLAPALANALAAATGRRLRNLPFDLMAA